MGFLESIGKAMQGLFPGQAQADEQVKEWASSMTEEEIEKLEQQGCDMSSYRAQMEAAKEERKRKAEEEEELRLKSLDMLNYGKLEVHKDVPRDPDSRFVQDTVAIAKPSSSDKKLFATAPIVYGYVVQANSALWYPGEDRSGAGIVFVFALDEAHRYDMEWLAATAKKISAMKESVDVPKDCRKFIDTLRNDRSYFCFKLGESLNDGAEAWCATYTWYNQTLLPGNRIPATRIIPFLLLEEPEQDQFVRFEIIPAGYYTK
jgi:hypothetical protein